MVFKKGESQCQNNWKQKKKGHGRVHHFSPNCHKKQNTESSLIHK